MSKTKRYVLSRHISMPSTVSEGLRRDERAQETKRWIHAILKVLSREHKLLVGEDHIIPEIHKEVTQMRQKWTYDVQRRKFKKYE